jgi:hypothetical protein
LSLLCTEAQQRIYVSIERISPLIKLFPAACLPSARIALHFSDPHAGDVEDENGLSVIFSDSLSSTSADIAFSISLTLPDNPLFALTSAPLSFLGSVSETGFGTSFFGDEGSWGPYVSSTYQCGSFFNPETCYNYSSTYYYPEVSSSGYTGTMDVTKVTDGTHTWTGDLRTNGSLDLESLGFGSDLTDGGTLTLYGNACSSFFERRAVRTQRGSH